MAGGLASQAGVDLGKAAPPVQFAGISEIVMMSATELAQAIQSRSVSCAEVMSAYLDHIDRMNSHVNAIVSLQDRDELMKQARERDEALGRGHLMGWLHGFPQAIKDLASTKGIRTTQGSPILADFVPQEDAIFVERIKRSGGIIIGKTNTPERYDYWVLPSAQVFPFDARTHWPKEIDGRKMDTYHRWMEVMIPVTMSACPALAVPAGF